MKLKINFGEVFVSVSCHLVLTRGVLHKNGSIYSWLYHKNLITTHPIINLLVDMRRKCRLEIHSEDKIRYINTFKMKKI